MTIANGEFETAGTAPGLAANWTSSFVSSEEEWADWDQNPGDGFTRAQEGFEVGWTGVDDQAFQDGFQGAPTDQEAAEFNSALVATAFDSFETEWPAPFHFGLIATVTPSEVASFSGADQETFETGWGDTDWTMPATTTAMFDSGSNAYDGMTWFGFSDVISIYGTVAASFNGHDFDGFEDFRSPERVTMNNTGDQFTFLTSTLYPVVLNDVLYLTVDEGTLPTPLKADVRYYAAAISGAGQTFSVKPSLAAAVINVTDDGDGLHYVLRDPAQWWTRSLSV